MSIFATTESELYEFIEKGSLQIFASQHLKSTAKFNFYVCLKSHIPPKIRKCINCSEGILITMESQLLSILKKMVSLHLIQYPYIWYIQIRMSLTVLLAHLPLTVFGTSACRIHRWSLGGDMYVCMYGLLYLPGAHAEYITIRKYARSPTWQNNCQDICAHASSIHFPVWCLFTE